MPKKTIHRKIVGEAAKKVLIKRLVVDYPGNILMPLAGFKWIFSSGFVVCLVKSTLLSSY